MNGKKSYIPLREEAVETFNKSCYKIQAVGVKKKKKKLQKWGTG